MLKLQIFFLLIIVSLIVSGNNNKFEKNDFLEQFIFYSISHKNPRFNFVKYYNIWLTDNKLDLKKINTHISCGLCRDIPIEQEVFLIKSRVFFYSFQDKRFIIRNKKKSYILVLKYSTNDIFFIFFENDKVREIWSYRHQGALFTMKYNKYKFYYTTSNLERIEEVDEFGNRKTVMIVKTKFNSGKIVERNTFYGDRQLKEIFGRNENLKEVTYKCKTPYGNYESILKINYDIDTLIIFFENLEKRKVLIKYNKDTVIKSFTFFEKEKYQYSKFNNLRIEYDENNLPEKIYSGNDFNIIFTFDFKFLRKMKNKKVCNIYEFNFWNFYDVFFYYPM